MSRVEKSALDQELIGTGMNYQISQKSLAYLHQLATFVPFC